MKAWAIKHWTGDFYIDTVRRTRAQAIASFIEQFDMDEEKWADHSRNGVHRAVRVNVSLEQSMPSAKEG